VTDEFLSFGGFRAHSGSLTLPFTGAWVADLRFADTTDLAATATLTCGDLALVGTIYRQAVFAGQRVARIVGGYGGWRKDVGARAYRLPGGISTALIARDLAAEVGETVAGASNQAIGDYFLREAAPAQRILRQLVGLAWYVDNAGVTQLSARPTVDITGEFLVNSFDPARGEFVISTESYAEFVPGATFSNALVPDTQAINMVHIESDNEGKLRHTVLVSGPSDEPDRMMAALREIIRGEVSRLTFLGTYGYVVESSDGSTVTARAINASLSLPPVVAIPLRNGVAGLNCKPQSGSTIAVGFLDGLPTQPFIVGGMDVAGEARAVICYGDTVNVPSSGNVVLTPGPVTQGELDTVGVLVKAQRLPLP